MKRSLLAQKFCDVAFECVEYMMRNVDTCENEENLKDCASILMNVFDC